MSLVGYRGVLRHWSLPPVERRGRLFCKSNRRNCLTGGPFLLPSLSRALSCIISNSPNNSIFIQLTRFTLYRSLYSSCIHTPGSFGLCPFFYYIPRRSLLSLNGVRLPPFYKIKKKQQQTVYMYFHMYGEVRGVRGFFYNASFSVCTLCFHAQPKRAEREFSRDQGGKDCTLAPSLKEDPNKYIDNTLK